MEVDFKLFRDAFFQEAAEHLATMEAGLLELEGSGGSVELMNAIFRAVHSIKGGSGMVGLDEVAAFSHSAENLLDKMREGVILPSRVLTDLLLAACDVLKELLAASRDELPPPATMAAVLERLHVALGEGGPSAAAPENRASEAAPQAATGYRIRFEPAAHLFQAGMDPLLVLREIGRLGKAELEVDLGRMPVFSQLDPLTCYVAWTIQIETAVPEEEVRDVFAFVEDGSRIDIHRLGPEAAPETAAPAAAAGEPQSAPGTVPPRPGTVSPSATSPSSIRVATEKVDRLLDLVGELVIAQSMTTQLIHDFQEDRLSELAEALATMARHTRELQERVMGIRMTPIGTIFGRFPRMVRDVAATTGKQIELRMFGDETELDKGMVERITDPLVHLIRNSADHGIEPAAERARKGKQEQGVISLMAFHQGGSVVVEISDDGAGLNTERIRAKAIERGLIHTGADLTEAQIHSLIFQPGFSTAEKVGELSGRGVGMDVVKKNIEALSGTVSLESTPGKGTKFRIKLPLTLAIMDGLLVRVGPDTFVMPLVAIVESIRPRRGQVKAIAGGLETVVVRDQPLPLVRLHERFGITGAVADPCQGLVVIVENEGDKMAFLVDELLGQQQIVIKSLETNYAKVEGILGATILGNGHVALILDIAGVAKLIPAGAPESANLVVA